MDRVCVDRLCVRVCVHACSVWGKDACGTCLSDLPLRVIEKCDLENVCPAEHERYLPRHAVASVSLTWPLTGRVPAMLRARLKSHFIPTATQLMHYSPGLNKTGLAKKQQRNSARNPHLWCRSWKFDLDKGILKRVLNMCDCLFCVQMWMSVCKCVYGMCVCVFLSVRVDTEEG